MLKSLRFGTDADRHRNRSEGLFHYNAHEDSFNADIVSEVVNDVDAFSL